MDAHEVERVEQLPAGRVRGMVAVGKFIVVDYNARAAVGGDVVVAAIHQGWLVHIREER